MSPGFSLVQLLYTVLKQKPRVTIDQLKWNFSQFDPLMFYFDTDYGSYWPQNESTDPEMGQAPWDVESTNLGSFPSHLKGNWRNIDVEYKKFIYIMPSGFRYI